MSWKVRLLHKMESLSKRPWYMPFVAFLAALDAYVFFVPNEILLIPAVLAHRKRWFATSLWISFGSAIGAASFAALASRYGERIVDYFFPNVTQTENWIHAVEILQRHGLWGLTLVSLGPFPQHPAVAVAGLAHMSFTAVLIAIWVGRSVKYLGVAWCSVHAPRLLTRIGIWPKSENS